MKGHKILAISNVIDIVDLCYGICQDEMRKTMHTPVQLGNVPTSILDGNQPYTLLHICRDVSVLDMRYAHEQNPVLTSYDKQLTLTIEQTNMLITEF